MTYCKKLILASSSPRRSSLLNEYGYQFEVIKSGALESMDKSIGAERLTRLNALAKANNVARWNRGRLVLSADTLVALGNDILGKPKDEDSAIEMLCRLSGRAHTVITAVALVCCTRAIKNVFSVKSKLKFADIQKSWIIEYVKAGEPMDKAGAYSIEGEVSQWVEEISGSKTNIIGLPMEVLAKELIGLGYAGEINVGWE